MTFCVGYNSGECVYLIADTVLSTRDNSVTNRWSEVTSFGEDSGLRAGMVRGEAGLKVLPIGPATLATFSASNVNKVFPILNDFRFALIEKTPLEALSLAAQKNPCIGESVSIMIADASGEPTLICYESLSDKTEECLPGNIAFCGSGVPHLASDVAAVVTELSAEVTDPWHLLTVVLAFLQGESLRNDLIPYGVGGSFAGGYVKESNIVWQPDICYFKYDSSVGRDGITTWIPVYTMFREDVFVIGSSFIDNNRKLIPGADYPPGWIDTWDDLVTNYHDHGRFDYFVFSDTFARRAVILETNKRLDSVALQLKIKEDQSMGLTFSMQLYDALFGAPNIPLYQIKSEFLSDVGIEKEIGRLYEENPRHIASLFVDDVLLRKLDTC